MPVHGGLIQRLQALLGGASAAEETPPASPQEQSAASRAFDRMSRSSEQALRLLPDIAKETALELPRMIRDPLDELIMGPGGKLPTTESRLLRSLTGLQSEKQQKAATERNRERANFMTSPAGAIAGGLFPGSGIMVGGAMRPFSQPMQRSQPPVSPNDGIIDRLLRFGRGLLERAGEQSLEQAERDREQARRDLETIDKFSIRFLEPVDQEILKFVKEHIAETPVLGSIAFPPGFSRLKPIGKTLSQGHPITRFGRLDPKTYAIRKEEPLMEQLGAALLNPVNLFPPIRTAQLAGRGTQQVVRAGAAVVRDTGRAAVASGLTRPVADVVARAGAPRVALRLRGHPGRAPAGAAETIPKLPRDIAGAKPRYGDYFPQFESDIDKALFIVAQTKKSASDAKYMTWLREQFPGMTDEGIRGAGMAIRANIKAIVQGKPLGDVPIPATVAPSPTKIIGLSEEVTIDLSEEVTAVVNKISGYKRRNSSLARKELDRLESKDIDTSEADDLLDQYTDLERSDFDDAADFSEARAEIWEELIQAIDGIDATEIVTALDTGNYGTLATMGRLSGRLRLPPKLPKDIAGATPQYGSYSPQFESDIDKALFIIAQTKKSASDAKYMTWLRGQLPGMSDEGIRKAGAGIRLNIKGLVQGKPPGDVLIPTTVMQPSPTAVRPAAPAARADLAETLKPVVTQEQLDNSLLRFPNVESVGGMGDLPIPRYWGHTPPGTLGPSRAGGIQAYKISGRGGEAEAISKKFIHGADQKIVWLSSPANPSDTYLVDASKLNLADVGAEHAGFLHAGDIPPEALVRAPTAARPPAAAAPPAITGAPPPPRKRPPTATGASGEEFAPIPPAPGKPRTLSDLNREADGLHALTPEARAAVMDARKPIKEGEWLWQKEPLLYKAESFEGYERFLGSGQVDDAGKFKYPHLMRVPGLKQLLSIGSGGAVRARETAIRLIGYRQGAFKEIEQAKAKDAVMRWWGDAKEQFGFTKVRGRLGIGKERWEARNVEVLDDSSPLSRTIYDLVEHPERYRLTPDQTKTLRLADNMTTQLLRDEQRTGLDVLEVLEDYWPRIIVGKPNERRISRFLRSLIGGKVGTGGAGKGHTRGRVFEFADDTAKAGFELDTHPLRVLGQRLDAGIGLLAERHARNALFKLPEFRTSTQKLLQEFPQVFESAQAARVARDAAKKAYLASKDSPEAFTALRQAEAQYLLARSAFLRTRRISQQTSLSESRVSGRIVPRELADEVRKFIDLPESPQRGSLIGGTIQETARLVRVVLTNVDIAAGYIQGQALFYRNNVAWLRAQRQALIALVDDPVAYVAKNFEVRQEGIRMGAISVPTEYMFTGSGIASIPTRLPLIGSAFRSFNRAFEWFITVGQTELYKAGRGGKSVEELVSLGRAIRRGLGTESYAILGVRPTQQTIEQMMFFAARFMRANVGIMKQAFTGGAGGAEARKLMGSLIAGGTSLLIGVEWATKRKLPNFDDPFRSDWMSTKQGKRLYNPFGPFYGYFRTIARSGVHVANGEPDKARKEIQRFLGFKAGIPFRAYDMIAQFDKYGSFRSFEGERFPLTPSGVLGAVQEETTPISLSEAWVAIKEGEPQRILAEVFGILGRRDYTAGAVAAKESQFFPKFSITPEIQDDVDSELKRLDIGVGSAGRKIDDRVLTLEGRSFYRALADGEIKAALAQLVDLASYKRRSEKSKEDVIRRSIQRARDKARRNVLRQADIMEGLFEDEETEVQSAPVLDEETAKATPSATGGLLTRVRLRIKELEAAEVP